MTRQDILEYFNDINEAYNNPNKHDDLSKMLDMLTNREDCYQVPKKALKYRTGEIIAYNYKWLKEHFDIEKSLICRKIEPCDAISREELIKKAVYTETTDGWSGYTVSAEDIKGMQSVQPKTEPCNDCISRQAVLDMLHDMMQMRMSGKEVCKAVYELPTVQPKVDEKKWAMLGRWKANLKFGAYPTEQMWICSICGYQDMQRHHHCPKCETDMLI